MSSRHLAFAFVALLVAAAAGVAVVPRLSSGEENATENPTNADAISTPRPVMLLSSGGDTASGDTAALGRFDPIILQGEVPAVSMALLKDGRVLYWSGVEAQDHDNVFFLGHPHDADSRVLDLYAAGGPVVLKPFDSAGTGDDLFCAGHTILPDGRVLAAGGTRWRTMPATFDILEGSTDARFFDPDAGDWIRATDMAHGRWYPSVITLPSGDALVASGLQNLTNPTTLQPHLERFRLGTEDWASAGDRLLPMYPRLVVVPSGPLEGQVFYSTVGTLWGPFGEHPAEAQWSLQQVYDTSTGDWRFLGPSLLGARQHAASVMLTLDPSDDYNARILTFGGTLQRSILATPLAEIADLSTDPPRNSPAAPMNDARWHLNGVLLPDGTVLAIGGGMYDNVLIHGQPNMPVMAAEIYHPHRDEWTPAAEMQVPRMYHSTALLLPDGRVLVGGHVPLPVPWKDVRDNVPTQAQITETRLEIYEPPYLHRGERPQILAAPGAIMYGASFTLDTTHADEIESVVLVRPGATTHAYDSEQRAVKLRFSLDGMGGLVVESPPNANVAPPGYYMLFVNRATSEGPVPSVAAFVHLS